MKSLENPGIFAGADDYDHQNTFDFPHLATAIIVMLLYFAFLVVKYPL